jgi:hypothetical protein
MCCSGGWGSVCVWGGGGGRGSPHRTCPLRVSLWCNSPAGAGDRARGVACWELEPGQRQPRPQRGHPAQRHRHHPSGRRSIPRGGVRGGSRGNAGACVLSFLLSSSPLDACACWVLAACGFALYTPRALAVSWGVCVWGGEEGWGRGTMIRRFRVPLLCAGCGCRASSAVPRESTATRCPPHAPVRRAACCCILRLSCSLVACRVPCCCAQAVGVCAACPTMPRFTPPAYMLLLAAQFCLLHTAACPCCTRPARTLVMFCGQRAPRACSARWAGPAQRAAACALPAPSPWRALQSAACAQVGGVVLCRAGVCLLLRCPVCCVGAAWVVSCFAPVRRAAGAALVCMFYPSPAPSKCVYLACTRCLYALLQRDSSEPLRA